jgi:hypothetical protein
MTGILTKWRRYKALGSWNQLNELRIQEMTRRADDYEKALVEIGRLRLELTELKTYRSSD